VGVVRASAGVTREAKRRSGMTPEPMGRQGEQGSNLGGPIVDPRSSAIGCSHQSHRRPTHLPTGCSA
jgi:hypothetical protein